MTGVGHVGLDAVASTPTAGGCAHAISQRLAGINRQVQGVDRRESLEHQEIFVPWPAPRLTTVTSPGRSCDTTSAACCCSRSCERT
jgi:hypothetical protein